MSALNDLINHYITCYNSKDISGMLECVTDDVVFENISNTGQSMRFEGRDAMAEIAQLSGNAFSYRRQKILNLIEDGEKACAEVSFEAKAAVDLPTGAKAGDMIQVRGASFFEFRNGLLSRIADYS
jgi:ketosteroid isomerase-like protein